MLVIDHQAILEYHGCSALPHRPFTIGYGGLLSIEYDGILSFKRSTMFKT